MRHGPGPVAARRPQRNGRRARKRRTRCRGKAVRAPRPPAGELKRAIQERLTAGYCVYCGAPARPGRPLTREHVIPRSRGAGRREWGVIVPACAECNRRRGARPLALFLLASPARLARLLAYFTSLPPEAVRQVDPRVFAELLATVLLAEELTTPLGDGAPIAPMLKPALHKSLRKARGVLARLRAHLSRGEYLSPISSPMLQLAAGRGTLPALARLLAIAYDAWEWAIADELRSARRPRAGGSRRLHFAPTIVIAEARASRGRRAVA